MTVSIFLHYTGETPDRGVFLDAYSSGPGEALRRLGGVTSVELYTAAPVNDPKLDEGEGPLLIAQARFGSLIEAERALASRDFEAAIADVQDLPVKKWRLGYDLMHGEPHAPSGETDPRGTSVPITYFVRYERPAEDEEAFIDYYRENHLDLLAALPGIRRCEVFTPVSWVDAVPIARADHMLMCDISFDSADALNAALVSEPRDKLREDFYAFPPFDGRVTHHGMARRRLAVSG